MIVASRDHGRVRAASAWAEFGQGAAARTVGKPTIRAVEATPNFVLFAVLLQLSSGCHERRGAHDRDR